MKKIQNILLMLAGLMILACGRDENEIVPSYLDGTAYGVLLHVDVNSPKTIQLATVTTAKLEFQVSFEGDKRPVASITVTKSYKPKNGKETPPIEQLRLTSFPATVSLTMEDLLAEVPGLSSTSDLSVDDTFELKFIITYVDGKTVSRYGTLNNPNFSIKFT